MRNLAILFVAGVSAIAVLAIALWILLPVTESAQVADAGLPSLVLEYDWNAEPIQPIPLSVELNAGKVALGEKLFADKQVSGPGTLACVSCHLEAEGGADGLQYSSDLDGNPRSRNTPTIYNLGLQTLFGWDAAYTSLRLQSLGILTNGMRAEWDAVIPRLQQDTAYAREFAALYTDGVTPENIADAVSEYIESLLTPNSRFDRFLRGDLNAITERERHGYALFKRYGCVACHQGVLAGGNLVSSFGIFGDYFADRGNIKPADYGWFNVTGIESDRFWFKVPSLRNVARTAPYLHDGNAATLDEAVRIMVRHQLGRELSDEDVDLMVEFLETLTGELDGRPL